MVPEPDNYDNAQETRKWGGTTTYDTGGTDEEKFLHGIPGTAPGEEQSATEPQPIIAASNKPRRHRGHRAAEPQPNRFNRGIRGIRGREAGKCLVFRVFRGSTSSRWLNILAACQRFRR